MKKIISVLIVAFLLATSVFAMIPASAAVIKSYNVDWADLSYAAYCDGTVYDASDYESMFNVTKDSKSLNSRGNSSSNEMSYVSTTMFDITATTQYEYVFQAKNNNATAYAGVPFAIDSSNEVYMIYGAFDNNSDEGTGSLFRFSRGTFDWEYPSDSNRTWKQLKLDGGFSTVKVVYNGLSVRVYAIASNGSYEEMTKEAIELPEGSKLVMGVHSRETNTNSGNDRTLMIKNAVVSAMNNEAATNLNVDTNGAGALESLILQIEKDYIKTNYTASSWAALESALENAKAVVDNASATRDEVTAAKDALELAAVDLKFKPADTSKLEKAIQSAKALKEKEYTSISYKMVMDAVEDAEALLDSKELKQTDVDAMTETLNGRIDALIPSGEIAEPDEDVDEEEEEEETEAPATQAPATQPPVPQGTGVNNTVLPPRKGCAASVTATATIVALVATLGTALVIKKKD